MIIRHPVLSAETGTSTTSTSSTSPGVPWKFDAVGRYDDDMDTVYYEIYPIGTIHIINILNIFIYIPYHNNNHSYIYNIKSDYDMDPLMSIYE